LFHTNAPHTGTYGGHLELSAFAHLSQRNVKVIQPGLVYVIEWAGGGGGDLSSPTTIPSPTIPAIPGDAGLDEREKRRLRRDQKRGTRARASSSATAADQDEEEEEENIDPAAGAVYVAYVHSPPDPC